MKTECTSFVPVSLAFVPLPLCVYTLYQIDQGRSMASWQPTLQHVPLEAFSLQEATTLQFVYTRFPVVDDLVHSIRHVGLLHPLLLRQQGGGGYQVLCGYRRLLACQQLGYSPLPALCYPPEAITLEKGLWMSLQEDIGHRSYTPLEKGVVLQKFHHLLGYSLEKLATTVAPLLKIPPTLPAVERYLAFPTLDLCLQQALHHGTLSPEQAALLLPLSEQERICFWTRVIEPCAPNLNETREIIGSLLDLKATLRSSMPDILERPELREVLTDNRLPPRKRCQHLRQRLHRLRYPLLSTQERLFRETVQALSLPPRIEISSPPHFEGNSLTVRLFPRTDQELQALLSALQAPERQEGLHTLFAILQGETLPAGTARE